MRIGQASLIALLGPFVLAAPWACTYQVECFNNDDCDDDERCVDDECVERSGGDGGSGGSGGGSGGTSGCSLPSVGDPSAVLRSLVVQGGSVIEAFPQGLTGNHPTASNNGCGNAAVPRGGQLVIPFSFANSDSPYNGTEIVLYDSNGTQSGNHIKVDPESYDLSWDASGGEIPIIVTFPEALCPGTLFLAYSAQAVHGGSPFLETVVTVTDQIASAGAPPQTCP